MSLDDTSLAIGQLQAGQSATNERLDKMETTLAGQDIKLDRLLTMHEQRRGERRVVAVIAAGVSSVLGLLIGWFHK